MAIEISVTNHDFDRSKLRIYAAAGVKECWIVPAPEKRIEIYRRPESGAFAECQTYGLGDSPASSILPEFSLSIAALFAK